MGCHRKSKTAMFEPFMCLMYKKNRSAEPLLSLYSSCSCSDDTEQTVFPTSHRYFTQPKLILTLFFLAHIVLQQCPPSLMPSAVLLSHSILSHSLLVGTVNEVHNSSGKPFDLSFFQPSLQGGLCASQGGIHCLSPL